tara:strand:+ start:50 stop:289 length:240 start_codon:yes stop_codon:yes gene_type:complete
MTTENKETISIDDKDYVVENMTEEQQYCIAQLKDLNTKRRNLKFQQDQLNAATATFNLTLTNSVKEEEKSEDTEGAKSE